MSELNQLQSQLARIFREVLPAPQNWGNHDAVRGLQKINKKLEEVSPAPSSASIAQTVAAYRQSQKQVSFRDLNYVCYGAAMQTDGWCVLSDARLLDKLLADTEQLDEPRRRFKCYQALLSSYFVFARYDEQTPKAAHAGWKKLRDWLANQRVQYQRLGAHWKLRLPGWFGVLNKHENLLTNQPCDRYGADMLRGNHSSIEEARQGLGINRDSWVMQEAILSQMKSAESMGDDSFRTRLDALLNLLQGQTGIIISDLLKRRSAAILVSRYARCASKPEHPALRDVAVSIIGNPWLKKSQWDAWVEKADGQPDDEARELVNSWLKRRLIKDFFDVLSEDGRADQRRLNYWLRFEPAIEGMPWLALGPDAMRNNTQPYRDLRERAKGRLLRLENPGSASNNAFIMKMGKWLIVEFGVTGNACYVYPESPAPFSLGGIAISLHDLKNKEIKRVQRLSHKDGRHRWEDDFDGHIPYKVGYCPKDSSGWQFDEACFSAFVKRNGLAVDDRRPQGDALWVLAESDIDDDIKRHLDDWKFKYKAKRGWWRE
jgi:hypothetical protein